jgi:hypothetical protein
VDLHQILQWAADNPLGCVLGGSIAVGAFFLLRGLYGNRGR